MGHGWLAPGAASQADPREPVPEAWDRTSTTTWRLPPPRSREPRGRPARDIFIGETLGGLCGLELTEEIRSRSPRGAPRPGARRPAVHGCAVDPRLPSTLITPRGRSDSSSSRGTPVGHGATVIARRCSEPRRAPWMPCSPVAARRPRQRRDHEFAHKLDMETARSTARRRWRTRPRPALGTRVLRRVPPLAKARCRLPTLMDAYGATNRGRVSRGDRDVLSRAPASSGTSTRLVLSPRRLLPGRARGSRRLAPGYLRLVFS